MSHKEQSSPHRGQLLPVMFLYALFAIIFGYAYRFEINPDGVSYIRLAEYIAEGNFKASVSGTWAPLFSWIMSPFLIAGMDGLSAARTVIALSGAAFLLAGNLLIERFNLSGESRLTTLVIAALLIAQWSIKNIGPDLLIGALITLYLYWVTRSDITERPATAAICGVIGGIAYFAKHYAFPFFLVHFPLMMVLAFLRKNRGDRHMKNIVMPVVVGMTVFFMVSSIWISVLSMKFDRFVISPAGKYVHAKVGPKDMDRRDPSFVGGLHKPINDFAVHSFEDPIQLADEYKTWSPFDNREYFKYQLHLIKNNCRYILNHFVSNSPFFTHAFIIVLLSIIPVALLINPLTTEKKYLYAWVLLSFSVYSSGHLLTFARGTKYFYPLMLLALMVYAHFIDELRQGLKDIGLFSGKRRRLLTVYLLLVLVLAVSVKPGRQLVKTVKNIMTVEQVNPYMEIAGQLGRIDFPSPYAIIRSSQKSYTDYYIAYYVKKQLTGRLLSDDLDGIMEELASAGAKTLLVFDNPDVAASLKLDGRYRFIDSIELRNDPRYNNMPYIDRDMITAWDREVSVFSVQ